MPVQVNDIVTVLFKPLDCCCPIYSPVITTLIYFISNNLVRNDEILHNIGAYLYLFTGTLHHVCLTSSISGRNACLSEEVTFTCSAQGPALFWGNVEFGERTMHYTSPRSKGEFRAEIVSYQQNCLVSSLSFRATASRNGTTVTCTSMDRSFNQCPIGYDLRKIRLET